MKSKRTVLVNEVNSHVNSGAKGRNESDNHADATCFGRNWRPLSFAGKVCKVMPFLEGLEMMKGVEVCLCHVHIAHKQKNRKEHCHCGK